MRSIEVAPGTSHPWEPCQQEKACRPRCSTSRSTRCTSTRRVKATRAPLPAPGKSSGRRQGCCGCSRPGRLRRATTRTTRRHADDADARIRKQEPLATQMESAEHDVGVAHAPRLEALATTHVLCAAALESHVNLRAHALLAGKQLDHFERISLEGKWLFLP